MDYEYLITSIPGLLIAAIVSYFVLQDAAALRNKEISVLGDSRIHPQLWGVGVFLLLIVFLPAYFFVRTSHRALLVRPCPACRVAISKKARVCPHCGLDLVTGATRVVASAAPTVQVPPGWLPDPTAQHTMRYWDGAAWTAHVHDAAATTDDSDAAPT